MDFFTKSKPWPHQLDSLIFGYEKEATGYFLDMGTGKSKVSIDEIVNHGFKVALILCPLSVVDVWPLEFEKHCPIYFQILYPLPGESAPKFIKRIEQADFSIKTIIVINYDRITPRKNAKTGLRVSALGDLLLTVAKTGAIEAIYCDESHRIKAHNSSVSKFCHKLGKYIPIRRALTGTPMADKPLDIFGQYRYLDDSIYGTNFGEFKKRYYSFIGQQGPGIEIVKDFKDDMKQEFMEKFNSIGFVVKSEDVQDLPKTQHIVRNCHLSAKARKIYDQLEKDFIVWLHEHTEEDGVLSVSNALVQMLRLHQVTSGLLVYEQEIGLDTATARKEIEIDTAKKDLLKDVLIDLDPREPVVVFYRYKHDLKNIRQACKSVGRNLGELNGQAKQWKQFQYDKTFDTLAVNIRSGGAGINLTRAKYHIFYTVGLSNADYQQALKRGHRHDDTYKHPCVTYYHLVVPNTMDEMIKNHLKAKGNLVKSLIKGYRERKL